MKLIYFSSQIKGEDFCFIYSTLLDFVSFTGVWCNELLHFKDFHGEVFSCIYTLAL